MSAWPTRDGDCRHGRRGPTGDPLRVRRRPEPVCRVPARSAARREGLGPARGHRLWLAPEAKPWTYELDNVPVAVRAIPGGVRTRRRGAAHAREKVNGRVPGVPAQPVTVTHALTNRGRKPVALAPWALSVMAPGGMAIIPLPAKIRTRSA